jgi:hypothetical protein
MSSEAILENPSLFNKKYVDMDVLIQEYLDFVEKYEDNPQFVKSHLHKMAYMGFQKHTDLREKMVKAEGLQETRKVMLELKERRAKLKNSEKLGWYY